jgi:uncharacterized protein YwqG
MKWVSRLRGESEASGPPQPSLYRLMEPGDPLDSLPDQIRPLIRTAYVPMTSPGEFGASSGFGGQPFLTRGVEHPICPNCHEPMTLLAQLSTDQLPAESRPVGAGLLQLFYCTDPDPLTPMPCSVILDGWEPFSGCHVVRLVPSGDDGRPSDLGRPFPALTVRRWDAVREVPNWDELIGLGIKLKVDEAEALADADIPHGGDKIGGWPRWIQGVEYPTCPRCGETMRYLLQIDSQGNAAHTNVPFLFGDMGTAHVCQCPNDPGVFAFGWACS